MQIRLKKSDTRWIDIDEESSFFIEYPVTKQSDEINLLRNQLASMIERYGGLREDVDFNELIESFNDEDKAVFTDVSTKMYRLTMKYYIKDWKGVNDTEGNPVKCKLIPDGNGSKIEGKLFEDLIKDLTIENLMHIYNCITAETELTDADKKKLSSEQSSITTESSTEEEQ